MANPCANGTNRLAISRATGQWTVRYYNVNGGELHLFYTSPSKAPSLVLPLRSAIVELTGQLLFVMRSDTGEFFWIGKENIDEMHRLWSLFKAHSCKNLEALRGHALHQALQVMGIDIRGESDMDLLLRARKYLSAQLMQVPLITWENAWALHLKLNEKATQLAQYLCLDLSYLSSPEFSHVLDAALIFANPAIACLVVGAKLTTFLVQTARESCDALRHVLEYQAELSDLLLAVPKEAAKGLRPNTVNEPDVLSKASKALVDVASLCNRFANPGFLCKWFFPSKMEREVEATEKQLLDLILVLRPLVPQSEPPARPQPCRRRERTPDGEACSRAQGQRTVDLRDALAQEKHTRATLGRAPQTPLAAAWAGDFPAMYHLLLADRTTVTESGHTYGLLHQAVFWEDVSAVKMLLNFGADVNMQTKQWCPLLELPARSTPLHIAAHLGNETLLQLLLCSQADVTIADAKGHLPAQLSTSPQCRALLKGTAGLLQDAQALCHAAYQHDVSRLRAILQERPALPVDIRYSATSDFYVAHHVACSERSTMGYATLRAYGAWPLLRTAKGRKLPSEVAADRTAQGYFSHFERTALSALGALS